MTSTTLDTDRLTLDQLYQTLRGELTALDEGLDYFSLASLIQEDGSKYDNPRRHQPIGPYRWIACYAVTGTSEGHYIHVDRLYLATPYAAEVTIEPLFLAKTFGGWDTACRIAAHLGARLGA